ncbi:Ldh family oxidoreductase [Achromobacter sp. F4_2707]|uniref:Ldh family oxidoreductase n=1 Tax=Achromobacter sp. F4_2707 TaxID=3114286 RepID=UPI0039C72726
MQDQIMPGQKEPADTVRIPVEALRTLLARIFERHGTSAEAAAILARNVADAQRDGADSHGVFRMPAYVSTLASGWVDGQAVPVVTDAAPGFISVDACNGFAQPAHQAAQPLLLEKVRSQGIALLAIHDSHHFAALWPDVEPYARHGFVALTFVNSMACVVPHGGKHPLFGTNPIAFAAPRAGGEPLVFDLATSAMAHGDIQIAAREGRQLPPGQGVDSEGSPTCDPQAMLDGGALLPFGGHKGSALSMMVELLAAALTGGNFSFGFSWADHPGAQTPRTGQLLIVIDPARGAGANFAQRAEALVQAMHDAGQPRLPGDRRYRQRRESLELGVALSEADLAMLTKLAEG